jgi:hypothetical protein
VVQHVCIGHEAVRFLAVDHLQCYIAC